MTPPLPVALVVDDQQDVVEVVARFARYTGFAVVPCVGGAHALRCVQQQPVDVAIVDIRMRDVNGLTVLREIRSVQPTCEVIMMTGFGGIEGAVEAIKLGAADYLPKPVDFARLESLLAAVRERIVHQRMLGELEGGLAGMIGVSCIMQETFSLIRRIAPHARTVLITGETGTGKELAARALHSLGPRPNRRFLTVNCSAVVETLFESELFGYRRGAFTGATRDKPGLFELAHKGTLFLDEIGELPLSMQAKLLRVLDLGEVQQVGALEPARVDVCVVAATNRDLCADAEAGRFRSDLLYRLNVVEVHMPPLRDRREDIPLLAAAVVRACAARLGKPLNGLTPEAERALLEAKWTGNVRELRNAVERACILAPGNTVTEREFEGILSVDPRLAEPAVGCADQPPRQPAGIGHILAALEREQILRALCGAGGSKTAAAQILGLSRWALHRRLRRLNLETDRGRARPSADH